MTVLSACALRNFPTGSDSLLGSGARIRWRVTTDDENDGPDTILAFGGLPAIGSAYAYGNDADPNLTCFQRTPRRTQHKLIWHVDISYRDVLIPFQYPTATLATRFIPETVENAEFVAHTDRVGKVLDYVPGQTLIPPEEAPPLSDDEVSRGAPTGSNLIAFDPPIEDDKSMPVVICEWYRPFGSVWDNSWTASIGRISDGTDFNITTSTFNATFDQGLYPVPPNDTKEKRRQLRLANAVGRPEVLGSRVYLFVTFEFWYRYEGWYYDPLNRGLTAFAEPTTGDDGRGGKNPTGKPGQAQQRAILDITDAPLADPQPLDIYGNVIEDPTLEANKKRINYCRWKKQDDEMDFNTLGLFT